MMLRVRRTKQGLVKVELGIGEYGVLRSIPDRLRTVLARADGSEAVTGRLFPSGYRDPKQDADFQDLVREELLRRKLDCIEAFERTLTEVRVKTRSVVVQLDGEDFEFWLGFLNDFRLVLGVELGIEDDGWSSDAAMMEEDAERAHDFALLHFLSLIQELLLGASGYEMPDVDPDDV